MIKSTNIHDLNVISYLRDNDDDLANKFIFNYSPSKEPITTKVLAKYAGSHIKGVLCYKTITINKLKYLEIKRCKADDNKITQELLDEFYNNISVNVHGVFFDKILRKDPTLIVYTQNQFIKYNKIYFSKVLTVPSNKNISFIKFDKSTRSDHKRNMIKLLTEHDKLIAQKLNTAIGHKIFPTNTSTKSHQIRLSYFIDTLIKDNWSTFLITDKDKIVGFIKGKISNNFCIPDVYVPDKYINSAYGVFIDNSKTLKYIGAIVPDHLSIFGPEIGYQLYLNKRG